jgi:hypothetical protein
VPARSDAGSVSPRARREFIRDWAKPLQHLLTLATGRACGAPRITLVRCQPGVPEVGDVDDEAGRLLDPPLPTISPRRWRGDLRLLRASRRAADSRGSFRRRPRGRLGHGRRRRSRPDLGTASRPRSLTAPRPDRQPDQRHGRTFGLSPPRCTEELFRREPRRVCSIAMPNDRSLA